MCSMLLCGFLRSESNSQQQSQTALDALFTLGLRSTHLGRPIIAGTLFPILGASYPVPPSLHHVPQVFTALHDGGLAACLQQGLLMLILCISVRLLGHFRQLLASRVVLHSFFVVYLGERNPTGWQHTIQLGEPNCREPEAPPHQLNTPHTQYQEVPSTRTKNNKGVEPPHLLGVLQPVAQLHVAHTRLPVSRPNKGV
jgi:hypothetical protein